MIGDCVIIAQTMTARGIMTALLATDGSRCGAGVAVLCLKFESITGSYTGIAIPAILNSFWRIIDKMGKKFARNIIVEVDLIKRWISNVYIDGVCFPYQILSFPADEYPGNTVSEVKITIPCEKLIVRTTSGDEYIPNSAEITAPNAYCMLLNENERLKQIIEDQNRRISILLDT